MHTNLAPVHTNSTPVPTRTGAGQQNHQFSRREPVTGRGLPGPSGPPSRGRPDPRADLRWAELRDGSRRLNQLLELTGRAPAAAREPATQARPAAQRRRSATEARRVVSDAEDRLFPITGYGDDFATGVCADGRQVVMGLLCPHVVAYFFDPDGRLVGDEHRPWGRPAPLLELGDRPYQIYDIYDKAFRSALDAQLREWQASIGYRPGPIRVRAFLDPEHPVGVTPGRGDVWPATGEFVWWWAKDYWMDPDGQVAST